jgi:hypothetical protein
MLAWYGVGARGAWSVHAGLVRCSGIDVLLTTVLKKTHPGFGKRFADPGSPNPKRAQQSVQPTVGSSNQIHGHGHGGTVRVFRQKSALSRGVPLSFIHAFAPLEALACVRPMPFLSGVHSSYRLAL